MAAVPDHARPGWEAELALRFALRQGRSTLVGRHHRGPLVVQKTLHPEGDAVCHAIILHPPGGVAGGDRLQLRADVGPGARALLTTPGAGKWYKANGSHASQGLRFVVEPAAVLEWLPQETIVYDHACADWDTHVELRGDAAYAGWEIVCLGRRAAGEAFLAGEVRQRTRIFREGRLLWGEHARLCGGDRLHASPVGLCGYVVAGTFVVAAGQVPAAVLEACREVPGPAAGKVAVSALPDLLVARCLSDNARETRAYLEAVWAVLRPGYAGAPAQRPRIWNS